MHRHAPGLEVNPLRQTTLRELGLYTRPTDAKATTGLLITRVLTAYLAAGDGWSIFTDCDFVFTTDSRALEKSLDPSKAIHVAQHDDTQSLAIQMDGKAQHHHLRKNWSSFIAFNGAHPDVKALTPAVVNSAEPAFLHRFTWTSDSAIGALDLRWNFLVGEYPKPQQTPAAIHYTNGGPWFENHVNVDYGDLWLAERDAYLRSTAAA